MPDLPEVTQGFEANTTGYVSGLELAIAAAERFRDSNIEALASVLELNDAMAAETARAGEAAGATRAAASAAGDAARAAGEQALATDAAASASGSAARSASEQAGATDAAAGAVRDLAGADAALTVANRAAADSGVDLGRTAAYLSDTFGLVVQSSARVMASNTMLASLNKSVADSFGLIRSSAVTAYLTTAQLAAMTEGVTARFAAGERIEAEMAADAAHEQELLTAARLASIDATLALARADAILTGSEAASAVATHAAADSAGNAGQAFRIWGTGLRLTGTAIHWIIAGSLELMAVLAPATVAAGAWAAVWLQGTVNVAQHMNAVYTATEAMANAGAKTAGQMVGLGDALQQAQNKANPDVYQALGGAINLVKENAGGLANVGLRVGQIFDTFMARVVYDFSAAGSQGKMLSNVLSGMIPDLTGIGQIFGNLGHLLLSFASQMPGLAEVLLGVLDVITRLAVSVVDFADKIHIGSFSILTMVMVFEELNRWGGLVVGIFGRMGMASSELATGMLNPVRAMGVLSNIALALPMALARITSGIGGLLTRVGPMDGAISSAGQAMTGFGRDAEAAIREIPVWQGALIALGAAGLGFLIYKLASSKTAIKAWTDSLQEAVEKTSDFNIFTTVASNITKLQVSLSGAAASMKEYSAGAQAAGRNVAEATRFGGSYDEQLVGQSVAYGQASAAQKAYQAGLAQQVDDDANVINGARKIASTYEISVPAAMALAQSAGVNLSHVITTQGGAWNALGEKVNDAYRGYIAMGQSAGMIGNDMLAVAIQTGEAGTQVSKLNQAWDAFMQTVTGGTGALSQLEESITNIGHIVTNTSNHLASSTGGMTLSTKQFAEAMTSYTGQGAQAWSNFDQIMGSTMPQLADWFRTAASEGALGAQGTNRLGKAILDMASTMVPFAAKSKTAQAELVAFAQSAGLPVHTFPELEAAIKAAGASSKDLQDQVSKATIALGNMSQVAQNLGDVMNSQVTAAISAAALKATGFTTDTNNLTQALAHNGTFGGHTAAYWAEQTASAYNRAGAEAAVAAGKVGHLSQQMNSIPRNVTSSIDINTYYHQYGSVGGGTYGHKPIPGNAAGAAYTAGGAALVGEMGPEIVHMPAGSSVTPSWATAGLMHGGGGGGGPSGEAVIHNHVYLDGEQIFDNQKRHLYQYNTYNSGNRTGTWAPS